MIPFQCRLRDKTHTPIIHNEDIWEYAEALVGDYKPSLLKEAAQINQVLYAAGEIQYSAESGTAGI